jgi:hypothetical protein
VAIFRALNSSIGWQLRFEFSVGGMLEALGKEKGQTKLAFSRSLI